MLHPNYQQERGHCHCALSLLSAEPMPHGLVYRDGDNQDRCRPCLLRTNVGTKHHTHHTSPPQFPSLSSRRPLGARRAASGEPATGMARAGLGNQRHGSRNATTMYIRSLNASSQQPTACPGHSRPLRATTRGITRGTRGITRPAPGFEPREVALAPAPSTSPQRVRVEGA